MKLEDWIEPYGIDANGESTYETDNKPVAYNIPSYKIARLDKPDVGVKTYSEIPATIKDILNHQSAVIKQLNKDQDAIVEWLQADRLLKEVTGLRSLISIREAQLEALAPHAEQFARYGKLPDEHELAINKYKQLETLADQLLYSNAKEGLYL